MAICPFENKCGFFGYLPSINVTFLRSNIGASFISVCWSQTTLPCSHLNATKTPREPSITLTVELMHEVAIRV